MKNPKNVQDYERNSKNSKTRREFQLLRDRKFHEENNYSPSAKLLQLQKKRKIVWKMKKNTNNKMK